MPLTIRCLSLRKWVLLLCCGLTLGVCSVAPGQAQPPPATNVTSPAAGPVWPHGDRVTCQIQNLSDFMSAAFSQDTYKIGAGDNLLISVRGRATIDYWPHRTSANDTRTSADSNEVPVTSGGDIILPLIGRIKAAGFTSAELEDRLHKQLSEYLRDFGVSVSIAKLRTVNVWISGEADNPGPRALPAVSTVSLAALQAGIKPTGSTRRITLVRGGTKRMVDLYKMTITGSIDEDIQLEPGDTIHIPAVTDYVEVKGEVTRPGRYEMVGLSGGTKTLPIRELGRLALGMSPAGAVDRAFIERIGTDGQKTAIDVDLRETTGLETVLQSGDVLVVPSVSAFQPMVRLIGEFKGEGVYQRTPGETSADVENKSGIYFLKQGQTARDVITATGGVTPQADLKRAHIERRDGSSVRSIPIDLDRLLINNDKSADVALENGDAIVLPAVADKVHVFGEVGTPGSRIYSPNRRLIDYLGDAGGPTQAAKLTDVRVVRGSMEKPTVFKLNASRSIQGSSTKDNPVLEPGDIVYVPSKFINSWRDAVQMIFTSFSLVNLLDRR